MALPRTAVPLLQDFLHAAAERLPDKIALVCQDQRVTYAEIEARSNALAHALVKRGVARGDRVLIYAENTVETAISFWAVLKANAVASVVSPLTRAEKLAHLIHDCGASALIADGHLAHVFEAVAAKVSGLRAVLVTTGASWEDALRDHEETAPPARACIDQDLAALIYTSGSTGEPKGVMLTHRNMLTAASSVTSYLENREDDVILGVLPFAFGYGLYQMITAFAVGARLVLERSFTYPAQTIKLMADEKVTGFPGVPTIFARLAEMRTLASYDLSSVRYVTNAAAALPLKHIGMLKRAFPQARIFSMYGLTECKRCTYLPPEDIDRKPTSIGIAIPNTELWLVDENDRRLGPGEVGQLVVRGATVMRGYWNQPEATARKLRPGPVPGEKVLYTGDLCRLDADGYLYFVARMDDVIKSRGEKVAPAEVESVIYGIPGVKEVAVIGVPDEVLGQAVKAFVVLEQGAVVSAKQIQNECQQRMESFMVPKFVELRDALPKTDTGKIRKTGLGHPPENGARAEAE